jgi:hypothetical protein
MQERPVDWYHSGILAISGTGNSNDLNREVTSLKLGFLGSKLGKP